MSLKTYVVKVKNIHKEKFVRYIKYLNNESHKNHKKHNTKIFSKPSGNFIQREKYKVEANTRKYIKIKKGGRKLKISNKSFTFNIPNKYSVSVEQVKEIQKKLNKTIIDLYKSYNCSISELDLYNSIHYQQNPHIHYILPYLDTNGNTLRFILNKSFTTQLKVLFTDIVDTQLNKNINKYQTKPKEELEEEKYIRELVELKTVLSNYMKYQVEDKQRIYFKSQIVSIDRILKTNDLLKQQDKLKRLNGNIQKINRHNPNMKLKNLSPGMIGG